jgi:outer membrane immunogenic protein
MKITRLVRCGLSLFLLLFPLLVASGQSSSQAPEPYTFKGFYLGANAGGGWTNGDTRFAPLPDAPTFFDLAPTTVRPAPNGWVAGGQGGYNFQYQRFVFGVEADIQGAGIDGTALVTPVVRLDGTSAGAGTRLVAHHELNWFGTVRPRFGVTVARRWLLYGTGGLAYGHVQWMGQTDYTAVGGPGYTAMQEETKVGWTAGGGVEVLLTPHWTVRAEYLYYDLGSTHIVANPVPPSPPFQVGYAFNNSGNLVRGGISFRF